MKHRKLQHLRASAAAVLAVPFFACGVAPRSQTPSAPSGSASAAITEGGAVDAAPGAWAHTETDPTGRYVLAWNGEARAVLSAKGELLSKKDGASGSPLFIGEARFVVERVDDGRVRVSAIPSLDVVADVPHASVELHAGAHRLLVVEKDAADGRWGYLWVFDTESGEKILRTPIASDPLLSDAPRYAVSSDGSKVTWALASTAILDVPSGKTRFLERRTAPGDDAGAPIFTTDAKHVCVSRAGALSVLPMPNPPPGYHAHCFSWPRSSAAGDSPLDADALVADIILSSGFDLLKKSADVVPDALSADHTRAVVTEISKRDPGSRSPLRLQLVAFDLAHDKTLARIPIGTVGEEPTHWSVTIDERVVAYCDGTSGTPLCSRYDLGSGAKLPPPAIASNSTAR